MSSVVNKIKAWMTLGSFPVKPVIVSLALHEKPLSKQFREIPGYLKDSFPQRVDFSKNNSYLFYFIIIIIIFFCKYECVPYLLSHVVSKPHALLI